MSTALEGSNKRAVKSLYAALASGDTAAATSVLAADLEWWFHGPPSQQHMMRVLTGAATHEDVFRFKPRSVTEVGEWVVAEGWEGEGAYWVHVWTVKEGVITQFREYFNTWVTVRGVSPAAAGCAEGQHWGLTVWRSKPMERLGRSLPGLVLAL